MNSSSQLSFTVREVSMKLLGYLGLLVLLDYTESYRLMPLSLGSPIGIVDNVWWNPAEESYGIFNLTKKKPEPKKNSTLLSDFSDEDTGIKAENLVDTLNEALNAIDRLMIYKLRCRLYEDYLRSVLQSSFSGRNLTEKIEQKDESNDDSNIEN